MKYSKKELRGIYNWLNHICFDDELTPCPLKLGRADGYQGCYWWYNTDGEFRTGQIELNGKYCRWPSEWVETLYHEMCHQFQREVEQDQSREHHSRVFRDIYDEGMSRLIKCQTESFSST